MAHRLEGRDPGRCGWGALTGRGLVSRADQTWIRPFALPVGATFVGDTSLPHLQGRTSLSRSDPVPGLVRSRQTVARLSQARDLPKKGYAKFTSTGRAVLAGAAATATPIPAASWAAGLLSLT